MVRKKSLVAISLILACILTGCANVTVSVNTEKEQPAPEETAKEEAQKSKPSVKNTYESDFGTYYEMDDGTWMYDEHYYKYRLEISGRMSNAAKESTFIYLSNIEDISFDRAVMASGLSSNMADYFTRDEAVFIGWKENKE